MASRARLDDAYFIWLYSQVASVREKSKASTYWFLLRELHSKEFVWFVANDDNRLEEGRDLRDEFLSDGRHEADPEWMSLGCSMLEMLVAFSRRLAFTTEGEPRDWFWHMLQNLSLEHHTDAYSGAPHQKEDIDEILDRVIYRNYDASGEGGIFPLIHPERDQRKVELWYQFNAYLLERE